MPCMRERRAFQSRVSIEEEEGRKLRERKPSDGPERDQENKPVNPRERRHGKRSD